MDVIKFIYPVSLEEFSYINEENLNWELYNGSNWI